MVWIFTFDNDGPLCTYNFNNDTLTHLTQPRTDLQMASVTPVDENTGFICYAENTHHRDLPDGFGGHSSSGGAVYRTTDGGLSWTKVLENEFLFPDVGIGEGSQLLTYNPSNHNELIVAGYNQIMHSLDNGDTWATISTPPDSTIFPFSIACICFSPDINPGIAHFNEKAEFVWFKGS